MIRINGGERKGAKLETLEGLDTRPLRGRIRESLFNIIRFQLRNQVVWDLFSGSGVVGLECLSEGAQKALLVEMNAPAVKVMEANIKKLRYEQQASILKGELPEVLKRVPPAYQNPGIINIMPPYRTDLQDRILHYLLQNPFDSLSKVRIIIETHRKDNWKPQSPWTLTDERLYGITRLSFVALEKPDQPH